MKFLAGAHYIAPRYFITDLCLTARIIDETNSMSDVYTAFYEFSSLIESKSWPLNSKRLLVAVQNLMHIWSMFQIDDNDPNAALTRRHVNSIKQTCKSSGLVKRRGYHLDTSPYRPMLVNHDCPPAGGYPFRGTVYQVTCSWPFSPMETRQTLPICPQ
ncbi:Squalene synthase 1 [Zea mays]|uniref:Squalene synthase 1 n=1 Tax=Zea mays TaxID=4577 RepID=A0A1D6L8B4_MAIZE|nr:Squalene synthase 1 [Zea mays]